MILALFLLLTGYFVGIYVFTRGSIEEYQASFTDLRTVHDRGVCLTKLFFYAREDMLTATVATLQNTTSSITGLQGFESASMDQLWACLSLEQALTDIKRANVPYLSTGRPEILDSDSYSLCDLVAQLSQVPQSVCRSVENNVFGKGLSLAQQDQIKSVLIRLLDYFSKITEQANSTQTR